MNYSSLWTSLSSEVKSIFDRSSLVIDVKRGEKIYQAGDQPRGIYFIESGLVGLLIIGSESGKEHLLRFFKAGQFFGHRSLFSNEDYHGNTVALETSRLRLVPKNIVLEILAKNPELYREILVVVSKELRRCENQHVMILENQILARTVSTIIKAMAELEDMGLISQKGRTIEILKRQELLELTN